MLGADACALTDLEFQLLPLLIGQELGLSETLDCDPQKDHTMLHGVSLNSPVSLWNLVLGDTKAMGRDTYGAVP